MSLTEPPPPAPGPESPTGIDANGSGLQPVPAASRSDPVGSGRARDRARPVPKSLRASSAPQDGLDLFERQMVWITGNTVVLLRTIALLFAVILAIVLIGVAATVVMRVLGVSPMWSAGAAVGGVVGTSWVRARISSRGAREIPTAEGDPKEQDAEGPTANQ